jgi:hypothetical protein
MNNPNNIIIIPQLLTILQNNLNQKISDLESRDFNTDYVTESKGKKSDSSDYCIGEFTKKKREKEKTFICSFDNCCKMFTFKWILERHMNSHFCFKLFKCDYEGCDKAYKSKENLSLHIKNKHLMIKPYQCCFCILRFSHRNGKYLFMN